MPFVSGQLVCREEGKRSGTLWHSPFRDCGFQKEAQGAQASAAVILWLAVLVSATGCRRAVPQD
jgi:hypothetical protein